MDLDTDLRHRRAHAGSSGQQPGPNTLEPCPPDDKSDACDPNDDHEIDGLPKPSQDPETFQGDGEDEDDTDRITFRVDAA